MAMQKYRYSATSDGVSVARPSALIARNAITTSADMAFTTEDEMSFSFLKKQQAFYAAYGWDTTQNEGHVIAYIELSPRTFYEVDALYSPHTLGSVLARSGPPIYYMSHLFKNWRGSIMLHLKIAKTDYHSGRLLITYTPLTNVGVAPTVDSSSYQHRTIVDVREGSDICLCIPWLSNVDYLDVDQKMGVVSVMVLNELRAPETTSQTVDILTYVSGGDDFEFAVPNSVNAEWTPIVAQMDMNGQEVLINDSIGDTEAPAYDTSHAELAVGEIFTSVRQLLLRSSRIFTTAPENKGAIPSGTSIAIRPSQVQVMSVASGGGTKGPEVGGDMYSFIAPMYTFARGGMRFDTMRRNANSTYITATLQPKISSSDMFSLSPFAYGTGSVDTDWKTTTQGPGGTVLGDANADDFSVRVPYYNKYRMSLVDYAYDSLDYVPHFSVPEGGIVYSYDGFSGVPVVYRYIAEDTQLTCFVGCPPLVEKSITPESLKVITN